MNNLRINIIEKLFTIAFNALMLLVGYPEEHLASKKLSDEVLGVVICLE